MSETQGALNEAQQPESKQYTRLLWFITVAAAIIFLIAQHLEVFGNILLVALGFGAVVLVHEFGHFIVAKLSDIHVEAFSIGFPPTLAGIQRTAGGWRIRILPDILKKEGAGESDFGFTIPGECKASETEYRIGLIPFGGFVKMLGQEDVGTIKSTDDPRSYANKPVSTRMAVITAGVAFNVISALIVFVAVFLVGIKLIPPVVGGVVPDSPAAKAGIQGGDEIIAIKDKTKYLDFGDLKTAAALSNKNQEISLKVRHEDGSVGEYQLVAKEIQGEPMKGFGIYAPQTLKIAKVSDPNSLYESTGLRPGDMVNMVDGKNVQSHWQMEQIVSDTLAPVVTLGAERTDKVSHKVTEVETQIPLYLSHISKEAKSESDLNQICSMVPRLQIIDAPSEETGYLSKLAKWLRLRLAGSSNVQPDAETSRLKNGDIIIGTGDVSNPTYREFRDTVTAYYKKELLIKVLRAEPNGVEKVQTVTVVPKRSQDDKRVIIGILVSLDASHPVVAKTINAEGGVAAAAIPRGAVVTAVNGTAVSNFYDIINQIRQHIGQRITISYRVDEKTTGEAAVQTEGAANLINARSIFAKSAPFEELKRFYKADGPVEAVEMGYDKTIVFIAQTYVTLKRLVSGLVSPKELMGPVGIVTFSYKIVSEQPLIYYFYFLGLIGACIAVFNFLPLPPLDGGHIVLLTIEKIKGSALSERTIGMVAYAGWVLIGTFFLYVTFNDIVRSFFSRYQ